jgi:hypothetical protein
MPIGLLSVYAGMRTTTRQRQNLESNEANPHAGRGM